MFNDPFDCTINYDTTRIEKAIWKTLFESIKTLREKDEPGSKNTFDKYLMDDEPSDEFIREYSPLFKNMLEAQREKQVSEGGIACLTEVIDNLLMWAHYSDGHRGFCLEFGTSYLPFYAATPVKYSDNLPVLSGKSVMDDILFDLATTKAANWEYEREWRIFTDRGEMGALYDPNALTGIYFGCAMPREHMEVIAMILQGSHTKLYTMAKSPTKFELERCEVKFTPEKYMPEKDDEYKAEREKAKIEFNDGKVHVLRTKVIDDKKRSM
jgi:hypothetical protein